MYSRRAMLQTLSADLDGLNSASWHVVAWRVIRLLALTSRLQPNASFSCACEADLRMSTHLTTNPNLLPTRGKTRTSTRQSTIGSPWKFKQRGESGLWLSDLLPNLAKQADKLCVLNAMHTDVPAHPQAFVQLHTEPRVLSALAWRVDDVRLRQHQRELTRLRYDNSAQRFWWIAELRIRFLAGNESSHAAGQRESSTHVRGYSQP